MRVSIALVPILATSIVAADPDPAPPPQVAPEPPPPAAPAPGPPAAAPAPAPPPAAPAPPSSALPPITITITNNNNGNNSNTVTQSNNAPVTVSTPVTVTVPAPAFAPPAFAPRAAVERYELPRHEPPARWLMIGATLGKDGGARASIDLVSFHRIALGIAGEVDGGLGHHARGGFERGGRGGSGRGGHGDGTASGEAYLAWTGKLGPLDLRAEVGAGIGAASTSRDRGELSMRGDQPVARTTTGTTTQPMAPDHGPRDGHAPDLAPRAQAALLIGLPIGHELGIVAGPEVSSDLQRHGGAEVTVFAGLRYSL